MTLSMTLKVSQPQEECYASILHTFYKNYVYHTFAVQNCICYYRRLELKASYSSLSLTSSFQRWTQDSRGKGTCLDLWMV